MLHSPSSQTRTPRTFLHGGRRHLSQTFSTPQVRYVFLSTTLHSLYRISFTNGSVYQGYRFGFSAQFGPATHFSLGEIPPASTGFSWKGAIEEVPQSDIEQGFFSCYFLVPKRDGGLRPILDLHCLNLSLYKGKFKMLTLKTIMSQIQGGDWFVTIDLKHAYFHIQVVRWHRTFLRFTNIRSFPLAPRTFNKCMNAALAPLRLQGIRLLNYLDDWLILANSRELVVIGISSSITYVLLASEWTPRRVFSSPLSKLFLGVHLDSVQMQARLAPARISNFAACLARFKLGHHVSVSTCRRLLGLMAAASPVLPLGLLHMRPFLWWMKVLGQACASSSPLVSRQAPFLKGSSRSGSQPEIWKLWVWPIQGHGPWSSLPVEVQEIIASARANILSNGVSLSLGVWPVQ